MKRKLSSAQLKVIRKMLAAGVRGVDIADVVSTKDLKVTPDLISRIKHKRCYDDQEG